MCKMNSYVAIFLLNFALKIKKRGKDITVMNVVSCMESNMFHKKLGAQFGLMHEQTSWLSPPCGVIPVRIKKNCDLLTEESK